MPVVLFAGSGSSRLEEAALEHARELLCRTGEGGPGCADCRRVARREHPDLAIAAPERRRRSNTPDFEEASESKETTIPTALVRALVGGAARLPYESALRVIVLLDVDRTEAAAFSALLKVLEEPPERTRFLLTATRPRLLPTTILSRVVVRNLPLPSRTELVRGLVAQGMRPDEAEARVAFGPADLEEARTLDLADARKERDGLLEAVSGTLLSSSPGWALVLASRLAGEDAAATAANLALLARLLRDAAAATIDPAGHGVLHRERFADLLRLGEGADVVAVADAALREASDLPESRRNPRLAVEAFALGLVRAGARL